MAAQWLTLADLNNLVGSERVTQLFDDVGNGSISDSDANVVAVLSAAESEASSRLLRSWSQDAIVSLAGADPGFVQHCAWVALEFAVERRAEFCAEDGKGGYWAQYERAIAFFESISKTRLRSKGESAAGAGANLGGNMRPTSTAKKVDSLVFTPTEKNPYGSGGY